MAHSRNVSVIGLGYVGLPVAVAFGKNNSVIGYDINTDRVEALRDNIDYTNEVSRESLEQCQVYFTSEESDLKKADFHIIAVPTPVDDARHPDLKFLISASEIVGRQLKEGDIVVYESTVYPGATEEECVPVLEKISGLKMGKDFFVGYSPERINPADKEHTFENIKKVVSGCDENTLEIITNVYGNVVKAGVHKAPSIKVAEAAKVIENTQRDLNIALMNELSLIFDKMDINTQSVIEAASTKWNFLPFKPGLVGGHCIGVDPYYLTFKAKRLGYTPELILASRRINDNMGKFVAEQTIKRMIHAGCNIKSSRIAILGLSIKENCSDLRNSRVIDVINEFRTYGAELFVHDPLVRSEDAKKEYNLDLTPWEKITDVDAVVLCVAHHKFKSYTANDFKQKYKGTFVFSDVKSVLNTKEFLEAGIKVWSL